MVRSDRAQEQDAAVNRKIAAHEDPLGAEAVRHPAADGNEHRHGDQVGGDGRAQVDGVDVQIPCAIAGSAVAIAVLSMFCMNSVVATTTGDDAEVAVR